MVAPSALDGRTVRSGAERCLRGPTRLRLLMFRGRYHVFLLQLLSFINITANECWLHCCEPIRVHCFMPFDERIDHREDRFVRMLPQMGVGRALETNRHRVNRHPIHDVHAVQPDCAWSSNHECCVARLRVEQDAFVNRVPVCREKALKHHPHEKRKPARQFLQDRAPLGSEQKPCTRPPKKTRRDVCEDRVHALKCP